MKKKRSKTTKPNAKRKVAPDLHLTIPDLVVLSLLSERPMHGYELTRVLEEREVSDWAAVSRTQVYYSLSKLELGGLVTPLSDGEASAGPERRVLTVSDAARGLLADALERESWVTKRPPPPFVTWMALSPFARPRAVQRLLARRRAFVAEELEKERRTLGEIRVSDGAQGRVAVALVTWTIRQLEVELDWLDELESSAAMA